MVVGDGVNEMTTWWRMKMKIQMALHRSARIAEGIDLP
jgi:hypothetical protein